MALSALKLEPPGSHIAHMAEYRRKKKKKTQPGPGPFTKEMKNEMAGRETHQTAQKHPRAGARNEKLAGVGRIDHTNGHEQLRATQTDPARDGGPEHGEGRESRTCSLVLALSSEGRIFVAIRKAGFQIPRIRQENPSIKSESESED